VLLVAADVGAAVAEDGVVDDDDDDEGEGVAEGAADVAPPVGVEPWADGEG
jgi:hypothetical protein